MTNLYSVPKVVVLGDAKSGKHTDGILGAGSSFTSHDNYRKKSERKTNSITLKLDHLKTIGWWWSGKEANGLGNILAFCRLHHCHITVSIRSPEVGLLW